ncbi:hypothetical protein [Methylobacterium radiotolerans]|uniref:hypothetical protein n=1 Tax=Methylobacterium radiotolerans TaxID=31998 RepID=UPI0038D11BA7
MIFRAFGLEVVFADVEASSLDLDKGSFPVEIGWCLDDDAGPDSFLISPSGEWDTEFGWSPVSQAIHGLRLDDLYREGIDVHEAVQRLEAVFAGRVVASDNPAFDDHWIGMVYEAARHPRSWTVMPLDDVYTLAAAAGQVDAATLVRAIHAVEAIHPHPHRAAPDAFRMARKVRALADVDFRSRLLDSGGSVGGPVPQA